MWSPLFFDHTENLITIFLSALDFFRVELIFIKNTNKKYKQKK